jgi:hypothetical protein
LLSLVAFCVACPGKLRRHRGSARQVEGEPSAVHELVTLPAIVSKGTNRETPRQASCAHRCPTLLGRLDFAKKPAFLVVETKKEDIVRPTEGKGELCALTVQSRRPRASSGRRPTIQKVIVTNYNRPEHGRPSTTRPGEWFARRLHSRTVEPVPTTQFCNRLGSRSGEKPAVFC